MKQNLRPIIGINSTYYADAHRWYKVPVNYVNAVYEAGGLPLIFPCKPSKEELSVYLEQVDGMLFVGGADYPADLYDDTVHGRSLPMNVERAETDIMLMKMVLNETDLPVLGICAGHQLLAISNGGKLIQHIDSVDKHEKPGDIYHKIEIKGGKWLKSIFNRSSIIVNSNHHQVVAPEHFPSEYDITACSPEGLIEAMEYKGDRFILGLQWHPERIDNEEHKRAIFEYFIDNTRKRILT